MIADRVIALGGERGRRRGVLHALLRFGDDDRIAVDGAAPERPAADVFLAGVLQRRGELADLDVHRALHDHRPRACRLAGSCRPPAARRERPPRTATKRVWRSRGSDSVACAHVHESADLLAERRSTALDADVIGGVTTFFTMAYIVVVNPSILSTPGTGMPFSGALTATVLIASSMTLLMGLYARLPFAVAPGMGLNAFFAFTIVLQNKVPWQTALGMVFWAGVLFLAVSLTPLREQIALAIPASLRKAAAAGHRPAADVHRPAQRRPDRRRSRRRSCAWASLDHRVVVPARSGS